MAEPLIVDTPRGPSFPGRRVTVYDLIPYLLTADWTEADVARLFRLTDKQVAAGRAYIFDHADTVLAQHLRIEERLSQPNPPEVAAAADRARETLARFKAWLEEERRTDARVQATPEVFAAWKAAHPAAAG